MRRMDRNAILDPSYQRRTSYLFYPYYRKEFMDGITHAFVQILICCAAVGGMFVSVPIMLASLWGSLYFLGLLQAFVKSPRGNNDSS